ncbi:hypothetical protein KP509_38G032800 [Ceratopteris richardii]|uniref:AP2/ERF domain-containing protein n=1 Tax=Ceratopteris richardii TaxID=49495 RepID=A0A8T2Q3F6_CERRI|nr:hypothetical protein KP509_38G032800 [Ceratopteris richardii]
MVKSAAITPPRARRPPPIDTCSGDRFKGVRRRSWGRWVSEIRIPHSRDKIWLGSYGTAEQAARAYDIASLLLRGPACSAFLNFPDSSSLVLTEHPRLASLAANGTPPSPDTIRATAAAAAAAEARDFSPPSHTCADEHSTEELNESSDASAATHWVCSASNRSCVSADESCWVHDLITLILSPKEKSSSLSFPSSLSPSIIKYGSTATPCSPAAVTASNSCWSTSHGVQCSSRGVSPDYFLQTLIDDFQFPLEGLARDGFTAISAAVTTKKRFDTETTAPSCEVDATQLWIHAC